MKVICPYCKKKSNAPDEYKGQTAKCPECKREFVISEHEQGITSVQITSKPESKNTSQTKIEICGNCGRVIGKLEQAFVHAENIVCSNCFGIFNGIHQSGNSINRDHIRFACGLAGATLLFLGVFMPFVRVPVMGSINYFRNGQGDGVIILILSVVTVLFTLYKKYSALWFTGFGSLIVIVITFINFHLKMTDARTSVKQDLADNPFAGLGEALVGSIQLDWGWAILILGVVLTLVSAGLSVKSSNKQTV